MHNTKTVCYKKEGNTWGKKDLLEIKTMIANFFFLCVKVLQGDVEEISLKWINKSK